MYLNMLMGKLLTKCHLTVTGRKHIDFTSNVIRSNEYVNVNHKCAKKEDSYDTVNVPVYK